MTTTLLPQPIQSSAARQQARRVTAPAFRLLGLQPREARLEVIRRAIRKAAGDARHVASENLVARASVSQAQASAAEDRLVQITTAAYRLLDPRRRPSLFERVQLLLSSEEEAESVAVSFWDESLSPGVTVSNRISTSQSVPRIPASQPNESKVAGSLASDQLNTSQGEEVQVALELFRSIRHRDRRAKVLWISVVALAASLTLALATVTAWL